jgi:hypothetical protein
MPPENLPAAQLWTRTANAVKLRVNHRSFWEAVEKAVGVTVDGETFVAGLDAYDMNHASHMQTTEHKRAIEEVLREIAGTPLKFRLIEGTSIEDWEITKQSDMRVAAMRETTYKREDRDRVENSSWEALLEYVNRTYQSTPRRQLPQVRARYLTDMLYVLCDAMDTLYPDDPDENTERLLGRVIERVANVVEVPPTMVALELDRLRCWQKQNQEQAGAASS